MPNVKVGNYFGGLDIKKQRQELKDNVPSIVVGTPGRIKQLATEKALNLATVRHFVVDECDKVLEKLGEYIGLRHCNGGVCVGWMGQGELHA